jgi:hypothetical protein
MTGTLTLSAAAPTISACVMGSVRTSNQGIPPSGTQAEDIAGSAADQSKARNEQCPAQRTRNKCVGAADVQSCYTEQASWVVASCCLEHFACNRYCGVDRVCNDACPRLWAHLHVQHKLMDVLDMMCFQVWIYHQVSGCAAQDSWCCK